MPETLLILIYLDWGVFLAVGVVAGFYLFETFWMGK
jgi:hypothetical protein